MTKKELLEYFSTAGIQVDPATPYNELQRRWGETERQKRQNTDAFENLKSEVTNNLKIPQEPHPPIPPEPLVPPPSQPYPPQEPPQPEEFVTENSLKRFRFVIGKHDEEIRMLKAYVIAVAIFAAALFVINLLIARKRGTPQI